MAKGINLLKKKKAIPVREAQLMRFAQVGSVVLLVFYCLIVVGIFSLWLYTRQESQEVDRQIAVKKQNITDLEKIESLQILLKQRLASLTALVGKKTADYPKILSYFTQFPSNEIILDEITLLENGKVTLSGQAVNTLVLSDFLESLVQGEGDDLFAQIILSSFTRQEKGNCAFNLSMEVQQ